MDEKLLRLADEKIEQMRHYNEITSRMIYEGVDGMGELIDRRQEIITAMDGISVEMRCYVNEQSIDRRETITKVLGSEEISGLTDELIDLQNKIRTIKKLRDEINSKDKKARERIKKLRDEAYEELIRSAKSKQTINYISPNTQGNLTNGVKFNITN